MLFSFLPVRWFPPAAHYKNPYPRALNVAPGLVAKGSKVQKAQDRLRLHAKPIYLHSFPV